ncbi:MAG: hypothetical protein L7S70_05810 [Pseudomonadales bacterium]|nr:hypothetical protein [Pseudomonadales bacterium]
MTKRSNRTRGNRPLNRGASLRARQMTPPRHTGRGGSGEADIDVNDPTIYPIWDESGIQMLTEGDIEMVMQ